MDDAPEESPDLTLSEAAWWAGFSALCTFAVVVFIGGVTFGIAFGGPTAEQRQAAAAEEAANERTRVVDLGARVYEQRCASCHGAEGQGGVGPTFAAIVDRYPDPTDHLAVVVVGRNQMPAFGELLNEVQIEAVVAYERDVLNG